MKRKSVVLVVVMALVSLVVVSSASALTVTVTDIVPVKGQGGTTVACQIHGTFDTSALLITTAKLKLPPPSSYAIAGTVTNVTASTVSVSFALPAGTDFEAVYDVNVDQALFIPGDGVTLPYAFQISPPGITSLEPSTAVVGRAELSLVVHGSNFRSSSLFFQGSSVRWNGVAMETTYNSPTQITAVIPASKFTAIGSAAVTVMNVTAGTTSDAAAFAIGAQAPVVTSLSPTSVWAGYVKDDIVLTVNGSNFMSGAHIVLSGGDKPGTTFVSASQLTTPLVAADISTPTTLTVSVKNPPFPPGEPSALALLLPVVAEATDPTVTINGADSGWHNTAVPLAFSADDSQSGVQKVQYQSPPSVATWTDGASYTVPVTTQGVISVLARAFDWCNRVGTASATVNIDTTKPGTDALNAVSVKRKKTAKLKYRITEPVGLSPSARVVLKIKSKRGGNTVKTIVIASTGVNATQSTSFRVTFKKGSYRWYVYATDLAGNTQANVDKATFTVK